MLGEILSAYEFMDEKCMELVEKHLGLSNPVRGTRADNCVENRCRYQPLCCRRRHDAAQELLVPHNFCTQYSIPSSIGKSFQRYNLLLLLVPTKIPVF